MKNLFLASALLVLAAPAFAEDLSFELKNESDFVVTEFYVSPTATDTWGPNLLEGTTLEAGASGTVVITDGMNICEFDIKLVGPDMEDVVESGNWCDTESYTLTK